MSRPEFPNCIMTSGIISRIKQEQEYYDNNQEECERAQQEAQERIYREQKEQQAYYENQQGDIPFKNNYFLKAYKDDDIRYWRLYN